MNKLCILFSILFLAEIGHLAAHGGGGGGGNSQPAVRIPTTPKYAKGAHGGFKISLKDNMGDSHYKAEVLIEKKKLTIYLEEAFGGKLNKSAPRVKIELPGGKREMLSLQQLKAKNSFSATIDLPEDDKKVIFHIRYDAENGLEKGKVIYVHGH